MIIYCFVVMNAHCMFLCYLIHLMFLCILSDDVCYMYVKTWCYMNSRFLCVTFRGRNGIYFRVKIYSSLRGSSCGKPQVLTSLDSHFPM